MVHPVTHRYNYFTTSGNVNLFEQQWSCSGPHRAIIIIVHGLGEHSGRYRHFAEFLCNHGYRVVTYDHYGHGKSEGHRAFIKKFEDYISDLDDFVSKIKQESGSTPLFVLGHSLGGEIVAYYAEKKHPELNGIILSSPLLKMPGNISPVLQYFVNFLSRFFPRMKSVKLDSSMVSHDPEIVNKYNTDPLVYTEGIPVRTGAEMTNGIKFIFSNTNKFNYPSAIFFGESDTMVDPDGSRDFFEAIPAEDKTLKPYAGLYHEILNEVEKETVYHDILNWLNDHTEDNLNG